LELKAQRKKPKKYKNIDTKEEIMDLLKQKMKLLRYRYDQNEIKEEEVQENRTALEKLENILEERKNTGNNYPDRELFEEEEEKMNEWKDRIKKQDEQLDYVHQGVKALKYELQQAGEGIDEINRKAKKTHKKMSKTHKKVVTQTQKLKDLVYKLRSSDKVCCDIILIMILLGLIGVLISIIKQKY
jgi:chromosome segregation ATPase